jgi:hypothetical protein
VNPIVILLGLASAILIAVGIAAAIYDNFRDRISLEADRADDNGLLLLQYGRHDPTCMQLTPFHNPYNPYACDCYIKKLVK